VSIACTKIFKKIRETKKEENVRLNCSLKHCGDHKVSIKRELNGCAGVTTGLANETLAFYRMHLKTATDISTYLRLDRNGHLSLVLKLRYYEKQR
jgi:hypothetical protein